MADITASVIAWSATEASNSPSGDTTIGAGLDDNLRAIQSGVVKEFLQGSSIASASTVNIGASGTYGFVDVTGTTTITSFGTAPAGTRRLVRFTGTLTLTHNATSLILPGGVNITTANRDIAEFVSLGSGNWLCARYFQHSFSLPNVPIGSILDFAASTTPANWLVCDGSAVSRTDYGALFAVIGTTWGAGDGSTTFNVPDLRGRLTIHAGALTTTEAVTASSSNGFTVTSNVDRWTTGMPVVLSNLSGFTTSATAGPTYYVVRISATNVRLATTLALAQNVTPDVTISGAGTCTLTYTGSTRTLATRGGAETHAQTISELLSHDHGLSNSGAGSSGGNFAIDWASSETMQTGPRGGNTAMNIMNPYAVVRKIIRAY